jgi:predicted N-acetyltransferase YhbS
MPFRVRALRKGELDGFLLCFEAAFQIDEAGISVVRNSLVNDPYFHPERVRVGVLDDQVVSHVVILHRGVYVGHQIVTVAGVTAVATHPAHQRRGFGTRVMQDALRLVRQQRYDLAMLTTRLPRFFARFGFRGVPKVNGYECPVSALARVSATDAYSVQRLDYNRDWPAIAAIYDQYSQGRTGMQVRDARFWETWPRRGTFPYGFSSQLDAIGLVAALEGQAVAYVAAHVPPEQAHVVVPDFGHLPGHEEAALLLLQLVGKHFLSLGAKRAVLQTGGSAPVLALLEEQQVPLQVEAGPGLMVLVPNRAWMREARLRNANEATDRLFRSSPPAMWHRDGY